MFENNRLQTLLDIKHQEIADLNETLKLYTPQSPIEFKALTNIMDPPELDLERSADKNNFFDFTYSETPFHDLN